MDKARYLCVCGLFVILTAATQAATFTYGSTTSIYTDDSGNQSEWLHLDQTWNLAYGYVSAQLAPGGIFDGYRYASRSEVGAVTESLFGFNWAGLPSGWSTDYQGFTDLAGSFFSVYLGAGPTDWVRGVTADAPTDPVYVGYHFALDLWDPNSSIFGPSTMDSLSSDWLWSDSSIERALGHFLVKSTDSAMPVPSVLYLLGFGVVGLMGATHRSLPGVV